MLSFNTLPYEIQQLIFHHVDSTKQLGECRTVCKAWDEPAECAMFSRQLRITFNNTRSLYMHLQKKPSRANFIKHIQLDWYAFTDFTVPLLRLAITPSIERITPTAINDLDIRFYQTLAQLVRESETGLDRLKSIPWPGVFDDTHYQTVLLLKDSLEEMELIGNDVNGPHEIANHLGEFRYLSKLRLDDCAFHDLPQVESIFGGARFLKEIDVHNCFIDERGVWPETERLQWMKQHVQINDNAITINATNVEALDTCLIEYFSFKYSKITRFDYEAIKNEEWMVPHDEISPQVCSLISQIPSYALYLNTQLEWSSHYKSFAGRKNVFSLYYGEAFSISEYEQVDEISSILEQDGKRTTQFWIYSRPEDNFFDTHFTFLQDISTITTQLHINFESPDLRPGLVSMTASMVLFKALEVMDHLEELEFISDSLDSVELDLSPQYRKRSFNTLHITVAEIQPEMFRTLDTFFHTISTLKLSCCSVKKDPTNTVCIYMPSTALGKLILTTEWEPTASPIHQHNLQDSISLMHDTYLMIIVQQNIILYFRLKPLSSNIHQVSFVEHFGRPRHATAFSIYCQLLASIELDLGDIYATIDVQKHCEALDASMR